MIGIDDMSFYIPKVYLPIETLAKHRNIEYDKLNKGLGHNKMALADVNEDAASMAANAVLDLIKKNGLHPKEIGRIYVGSESAFDGAKPIGSYVISLLDDYFETTYRKNAFLHTDVVDMTFACIAGVDAMQTTIDWINSDPSRIGIVVCTDNAKYELKSTGEYTQGAGAVAMLIKNNPRLIGFNSPTGVACVGEHDFFKPLRKVSAKDVNAQNLDDHILSGDEETVAIHKVFPVFDGQYSTICYANRLKEAYEHFTVLNGNDHSLERWDKMVFHLPYAFHGKRAFLEVFFNEYKNSDSLKEQLVQLDNDFFNNPNKKLVAKTKLYRDFVSNKIEKGQRASSEIGNLYTGSIFMSLMSLLESEWLEGNDISNKIFGFCAYGSGSKAKVFEGVVQDTWKDVVSKFDLFTTLETREAIDFSTYENLHNNKIVAPISTTTNKFHLKEIATDAALYGVRTYNYG